MAITRRFFCLCLACAPAGRLDAQDAPSPAIQPARELHGLVEPSLHVAKAGSGKPPRVALTFDACSGATDRRILDVLMAEEIPATLFVTGRWLNKNAETIALLKSRPDLFAIENHGLNHIPAVDRPGTVYGIETAGTPQAVAKEVEGGETWIAKAGFARSGWFRGATARYSISAMTAIEAMGYRIAGYSLNGDQGATASTRAAATRVTGARDGDVVIAHINHPEKPAGAGIAEGLLALKRKGVTFVKLDEATANAAAPAPTPAPTPATTPAAHPAKP